MINTITYNLGTNDMDLFIKNPNNPDHKIILDKLNLKCKHVHYLEREYAILNYDKTKMAGASEAGASEAGAPDAIAGLFRSAVIRNGKILAFSPPKSMNECAFMSQYPPSECSAEEIIDGTMINLFYDDDHWEISSKSLIGANCRFFINGNAKEKETFRSMFFEVCKEIAFDYTTLPKENCYSFVFQHPANRIVVPINKMKLYLIAAYSIDNYTISKINDFITDGPILRPKKYNFTSYDDLESLIMFMNDDYKEPGIMIYHESGERTKIRNPNYEFVRGLRGNQPKLQYHYLELRQSGKVKPYLHYYPEALTEFTKFKQQIHTFTEKLQSNYVSCYIKKENPLLIYEDKFRKHMFNIHQIYKKKAEGSGKIITKYDIIQYVNTLPPAVLLFTLNYEFNINKI